jgi:hypothetical protein
MGDGLDAVYDKATGKWIFPEVSHCISFIPPELTCLVLTRTPTILLPPIQAMVRLQSVHLFPFQLPHPLPRLLMILWLL